MDMRQLRQDALHGRVSVEQLLDIVEQQQHTIRRLKAEVERHKARLAPYEPEVRRESADQGVAGETSVNYSVDAENKRRRGRRRRKKSPGRRPTKAKFAAAQRTVDIYPKGVPRRACHLVRERAVWRLEKGRAKLVGYRIFAGPDGIEPRVAGVTPRCEYGIEILVVLAFLVYKIGISQDKACAVLSFFCQLSLSRSQADALLRQLARHWHKEFELLCDLLVQAAVVYLDETGWKMGTEGCSLWAFATQWKREFLQGCQKDEATLDKMLPPDMFGGVGVSDDASVYRERFRRAQKCWAHLLRKAIRLALLYPRHKKYQRFLDGLLGIFRAGQRAAEDGRLGEAGRKDRVAELEGQLCELCLTHWRDTTPDMKPHERDFTNLVNELLRLVEAEELFTFVLRLDGERASRRPTMSRSACCATRPRIARRAAPARRQPALSAAV